MTLAILFAIIFFGLGPLWLVKKRGSEMLLEMVTVYCRLLIMIILTASSDDSVRLSQPLVVLAL